MSRFKEIDLGSLQRYSISDRHSKVRSQDFAKTGRVDTAEFLASLPDILKASDLKELLRHCKAARQNGRAIIIGLGGHVIKCGLAPLLIEMMNAGFVDAFVCNGSVTIHDFEIAMYGSTSEDVSSALADGSFGMATETCDGINDIIAKAAGEQLGYGEALGQYLAANASHKDLSLLAAAHTAGIPVCVHVAMGTDIVHQHNSANGAAIGECSLRDFRILCERMSNLGEGGVFINFGSAVIVPEVFLKALTVARNIFGEIGGFYTAVFDMHMHYRPAENIVNRPTQNSGKGYYFIGHHEIMIPLFIKSLL
ncbi:MAG: hypothetical protein U1C33_06480 [Candidatus Cloacimonadaceae bacterium]|nr:hypothetical protein [Candidatus Cloacimonadaceae bacterium]